MPKPISRRLDALLMAYKGSKPKKAKTVQAQSALGDVRASTSASPYGSGTSNLSPILDANGNPTGKNQVQTNLNYSPQYGAINQQATEGLSNNLGYLNRSPDQAVSYATSGQDPYYNTLNEQNNRTVDQAIQQGRLGAIHNGMQSSTALGGYLGSIQNDNILRHNQILQSAIDYGRNSAAGNLQANQGVIGGLAGLLYPLGEQSNSNLQSGLQTDASQAQNYANAQNAANLQYAQQMAAYQQSQGKGGLFGTIGGALGGIAGSFGGPLGSSLGGAIGHFAGNALGGAVSGGGGGFQQYPVRIGTGGGFQSTI